MQNERWPVELLLNDFFYHKPGGETLILFNELRRRKQPGGFRTAKESQRLGKELDDLFKKFDP